MFHILVVDDDKNTRLLLKAVLESEGYTVYAAQNGEDALPKPCAMRKTTCRSSWYQPSNCRRIKRKGFWWVPMII